MTQDELKRAVAQAALAYVPENEIIGVGTGSTANCFIDALGAHRFRVKGAVASSNATAERLQARGIPVVDLADVDRMSIYIDGADEIDARGAMIKGGGGALTREKIVASVASRFLCIADGSKLVERLGRFPLPVEIIPMAKVIVSRRLTELGGRPVLRLRDGTPYLTDNGNWILDVSGLSIDDAVMVEAQINNIPGVVTVGLFAQHGADACLLGTEQGVKTLTFGEGQG